ncbi:hypothetical protein [Candidatus Avelusimicrobium stercoris]|uniref:hypothetical protein n=1 Tax=Candidatus Avelusimicrobium stercoris TaxID=1947924 RepID=UPI003D12A329
MKQLVLALLLLGLAVPGSAQAGKAPVVAAKQVKKVATAFKTRVPAAPRVSSKVLKQQYALVSRSLDIARQVYSQQVAQILTDASLAAQERLLVLEKLEAETAALIASLNERALKSQAQWGERLLVERNPNFLPKKDANIPGMLSESAKPTEYPDMSPAFFREVVALVPEYEELPEEVNMLAVALGKKLGFMEQTITQLKEVKLAANKKVAISETEMEKRFYRNQVKKADRELAKLSKQAAQAAADLVDLMNLYPALYKDALTLVAAKLDTYPVKTDFVKYLRGKVRLPSTVKEEAPRRRIGFN